jgi:hypothetical protein
MTNLFNGLSRQSIVSNTNFTNDFHKRVGISYWQRLGRFYSFRKLYSIFQNQIQNFNSNAYKKRLQILDDSMFKDISVNNVVADIEQQSVFFGLQLPHYMVEEIYEFATHTLCTEPKHNDEFLEHDVKNGRLKNGRYVMRGLVSNVMNCDAIRQLVHDPVLLDIVRQYLKYWPTLITQHLTWSFASDLPEAEIKKIYPPTNFHYDVAGFNFMTIYFYITDVDVDSGPHIMIKNSQKRKPLRMLLASNRQFDEDVYSYYGKESELVITGKSGFGFIQDPSCIHKVKPTRTSNRLLLQIRYS